LKKSWRKKLGRNNGGSIDPFITPALVVANAPVVSQ